MSGSIQGKLKKIAILNLAKPVRWEEQRKKKSSGKNLK
jgi:hypothetical protein